ncbi:hypothetical protein [Aeromicrobium sp. UC242_57]|uniref:hypothetical protein n=1 Tax=Aeromicrobium sp. UC242_57 TaxID=3374624 RepID=UPI00379F166B
MTASAVQAQRPTRRRPDSAARPHQRARGCTGSRCAEFEEVAFNDIVDGYTIITSRYAMKCRF